jgi:23S rRNA-/tRNA-specific pseudouridylate synthase
MKSFTINGNDAGQRFDKFIEKSTYSLPKSLMYKFLRTKRIKLNGKKAEISTRINEGDIVEMYIPDEFFVPAEEKSETEKAERIKIRPDIIYEDENILLVDKKPGLSVHEDETNEYDVTNWNRCAELKALIGHEVKGRTSLLMRLTCFIWTAVTAPLIPLMPSRRLQSMNS